MALLTDAVLADVLRWCAGRDRDASPISVSVNVSAADLDLRLVSQVQSALERWRIPPQQLTLEITESAVTKRPVAAVEILGRLKSLGTRLSIDDFGTGFSSLERLGRLPVDEIKIDRAFVQDMRESNDGAMVKAIAALGHSLGLTVVIEGVEHESELAIVAALGCDLAQGFVLSAPTTPPAFETWLASYLPHASSRQDTVHGRPAAVRGRPPAPPPGDTRRTSDRLRAIAQTPSPHPTLEATLQELLGALATELGAKFAACWINDAERAQLEPLAFWSAPAAGMRALVRASRDLRYAPGHGLPGIVLDSDTIIYTEDFNDDPRFLRSAATRATDCSSVVAFPLRSNNQPIGVLEFLGSDMAPRAPRLNGALRDVGVLVGEFIRARQAEEEVASLTQILVTITDTVAHLSSATPEHGNEQLCAATRSFTNAHAVLLWQPRADAHGLIVTASSGVRVGVLQVSLTDEHSGAAAAYHSRTPSFVADVSHHAVPSQRLARAVDAASALYQPITHQGVTVGVLAIAWKQRQARVPTAIQHAVELLAQASAPFLHQHQTPHKQQ